MRFTNKLVGTFASLLLAAGCVDLGTSDSAVSGGGGDAGVGDGSDCTLTQGYWKNHPDAWPVGSLTLGSRTYTKAELLVILKTPVKGNGLIMLAHQLIAAKLNIAAGADGTSIDATIAAADALIGNLEIGVDTLKPRDVSALNDTLDAFNNGNIGPGHCDDKKNPPPPSCDKDDKDCDGDDDHDDDCDHDDDGHCDGDQGPECGNGQVEVGEQCDDGNKTAGDGCSATCELELPICGNGIVEHGEECDDGNLINGDGCSVVCLCE
jgi:cysteine-rich repeat protein